MKHLLKFAMGAAIAGALVTLAMKQRGGGRRETAPGAMPDAPSTEGMGRTPPASGGFTVEELAGQPEPGGGGNGLNA